MKRFIQVSLAIVMVAAMTCVAYARYGNIGRFTISGNIGSTSVSSMVSVTLNGNYSSLTEVTLERSSDGGNSYRDYCTLETKESSSANYKVYADKSGLSSAYDYRVKAELYVYDDAGNEIEYDCTYLD